MAITETTREIAKAAPDDPHLEDVEDRARYRADEIVDALDFSLLQEHAGEIGDDLEPVVGDAVVRAVAQIGPDDKAGLVDQVNARAVAIARERAAELVGMHYDARYQRRRGAAEGREGRTEGYGQAKSDRPLRLLNGGLLRVGVISRSTAASHTLFPSSDASTCCSKPKDVTQVRVETSNRGVAHRCAGCRSHQLRGCLRRDRP